MSKSARGAPGNKRRVITEHELNEYMSKNGSLMSLGTAYEKIANRFLGTKSKRSGTTAGNPHVGNSAPLQAGIITSGPVMNFGSASHGGQKGLKLSGSQAWLDVSKFGSGATQPGCLLTTGSAATTANLQLAIPFDPNDNTKMTSPLVDMMSLFLKYRLVSIQFRYVPRCPTSTTGSACVVWLPDAGLENTHLDTYTKVSEIQNSLAFPFYQPWKLKPPVLDSDIKFMDDLDASSAEIRLCMPGKFVGVADTNSGVALNVVQGTIWLDYTVECFEMIPRLLDALCLKCGSSSVRTKVQLRKRLMEQKRARDKSAVSDEELLRASSSLVEASAGTLGYSPDEDKSETKVKVPGQLVLGESPDDYYVKVPSVGRVQTQTETTESFKSRTQGVAPTPTNTPLPFSRKS
jgi:hypothetical protein